LEQLHVAETASVMRLLSDQMILEFIESHTGQALTIDAIISSMVASAVIVAVDVDVDTIPDQNLPLKPKQAVFPGGFRQMPNKFLSENSIASTTIGSALASPSFKFERTPDKTLVVSSESLPLLSPYSKSILAVHNQMVVEGSLPSLQPERALSEDQLIRMGSEKNGVNNVVDDILRKRQWESRRTQQKVSAIELFVPTSKKDITEKIAPLTGIKAPRALKTSEFDPKDLPRSPYKDGNEMGKIMAYGIPSGAGLPISKKYYESSQKIEFDRNGQPVKTAAVQGNTSSTVDLAPPDNEMIDEANILEYMLSMKS